MLSGQEERCGTQRADSKQRLLNYCLLFIQRVFFLYIHFLVHATHSGIHYFSPHSLIHFIVHNAYSAFWYSFFFLRHFFFIYFCSFTYSLSVSEATEREREKEKHNTLCVPTPLFITKGKSGEKRKAELFNGSFLSIEIINASSLCR